METTLDKEITDLWRKRAALAKAGKDRIKNGEYDRVLAALRAKTRLRCQGLNFHYPVQ